VAGPARRRHHHLRVGARRGRGDAAEDRLAVACAAQNFMLHLWSEGVASKWSTASVWEHKDFWPLLGKASGSEQEDVIGLFFYGHAAEAPPAKRNKELKDVLVDFRAAR
jgi:nitroreductase